MLKSRGLGCACASTACTSRCMCLASTRGGEGWAGLGWAVLCWAGLPVDPPVVGDQPFRGPSRDDKCKIVKIFLPWPVRPDCHSIAHLAVGRQMHAGHAF